MSKWSSSFDFRYTIRFQFSAGVSKAERTAVVEAARELYPWAGGRTADECLLRVSVDGGCAFTVRRLADATCIAGALEACPMIDPVSVKVTEERSPVESSHGLQRSVESGE